MLATTISNLQPPFLQQFIGGEQQLTLKSVDSNLRGVFTPRKKKEPLS
jgi:hypothetical protein